MYNDGGTAACAFDGKKHCLLLYSGKAQPPPEWSTVAGGDGQMISLHQALLPLVPPSGDTWIAQNKFCMWQLVGGGITSLHWFDFIPSKKSARKNMNRSSTVGLFTAFVFFCSWLFMFFLFSGWVSVQEIAIQFQFNAFQWVGLFPPAIKLLHADRKTKLKPLRTIHFQSKNVSCSSVPPEIFTKLFLTMLDPLWTHLIVKFGCGQSHLQSPLWWTVLPQKQLKVRQPEYPKGLFLPHCSKPIHLSHWPYSNKLVFNSM